MRLPSKRAVADQPVEGTGISEASTGASGLEKSAVATM
jgi:hypothetical protein